MIFAIPRRGGRDIFVEVNPPDPEKVDIIRTVNLEDISLPTPMHIDKPNNNTLGKMFDRVGLDRDFCIEPTFHTLTDKEIGHLIADSMFGNYIADITRREWADKLLNNIFERTVDNDGK